MKDLIIIGAGGMGREVFHLATQCEGYLKSFRIKGFIDDNSRALDGFKYKYPPIVSSVLEYKIKQKDIFTCSIGDVMTKKRIIEYFVSRGGNFISLIHPNVDINITATLGVGCLVFPQVHIGTEVVIGNHVMIQSYAAVGHDVTIGDFTRIDPKASCVGGVIVGKCVTIHTMAVINHKVTIEDNSVIGALSFVIRNVRQGITVFGIPAKEL